MDLCEVPVPSQVVSTFCLLLFVCGVFCVDGWMMWWWCV